jgi:hypothetical protein
VIQTLLDTILDDNDKPVAAPGYHDEFLILKGQSLRKTRPRHADPLRARAIQAIQVRPPHERTLKEIMGLERNGELVAPGQRRPIFKPRHRPRA